MQLLFFKQALVETVDTKGEVQISVTSADVNYVDAVKVTLEATTLKDNAVAYYDSEKGWTQTVDASDSSNIGAYFQKNVQVRIQLEANSVEGVTYTLMNGEKALGNPVEGDGTAFYFTINTNDLVVDSTTKAAALTLVSGYDIAFGSTPLTLSTTENRVYLDGVTGVAKGDYLLALTVSSSTPVYFGKSSDSNVFAVKESAETKRLYIDMANPSAALNADGSIDLVLAHKVEFTNGTTDVNATVTTKMGTTAGKSITVDTSKTTVYVADGAVLTITAATAGDAITYTVGTNEAEVEIPLTESMKATANVTVSDDVAVGKIVEANVLRNITVTLDTLADNSPLSGVKVKANEKLNDDGTNGFDARNVKWYATSDTDHETPLTGNAASGSSYFVVISNVTPADGNIIVEGCGITITGGAGTMTKDATGDIYTIVLTVTCG